MNEYRIRNIAVAIVQALKETDIELVLAHGAGSYGHIKAKQYRAQQGIHPDYGWEGYYLIRQDMMFLNLRFIQLCAEENLFPITIQPSAIITAKAGNIVSLNSNVIKSLLESNQIPLLHGDIVVDESQGFTIASTEDILSFLASYLPFNRVIMVSDVPGVLDAQGEIIPVINHNNFDNVMSLPGRAKGADVTGGMKKKVEHLYNLIRKSYLTEACILSCNSNMVELKNAIIGIAKQGTRIIY